MSSPWTKLVQEKFRLGRLSNPSYSLKEAMKSAKKVYKKGNVVKKSLKKTIGKTFRRKSGRRKSGRRKSGRRKSGRR